MSEKVYIKRLILDNFRNYAILDESFDERHIVLTGENGVGKTNLMEAISLLTPGRGIRRSPYIDLLRKDGAETSPSFSIFTHLVGMEGPVDIGTGLTHNEPGSRRIRINGANAKANDELLDHVRILWLTPAMDGLFTGSASDRRRFLDRMVLAIDPSHGKRSLAYERAMRSRNKLLGEGRFDPVWLDGIEEQMAEIGIAISLARHEFVRMLTNLIAADRSENTFPSAVIDLEGFDLDGQTDAAADLEAAFIDELKQHRSRDAAAGRALTGPHRMDLNVQHNLKQMPAAYCSTGEQKALLIGLVLAHSRLVKNLTDYAPILLLDEVAAHLDEKRRSALFDLIEGLSCQAFMTGTDRSMFDALANRAQYIDIDDGQFTDTR